MNLAELQSLFWRSMRSEPASPEVDRAFVSKGALGARERMAIYREMYWLRLMDVLGESFPRLGKALSEPELTRLFSRYVQAHPSEAPAIERVGFALADFLENESECLRQLAGVARLEWLQLDAFIAPDAKRIASLSEIRPELFAAQRFELVPSLRLAELFAGSLERWTELDPSSPPPETPTPVDCARRVPVAVWRLGFAAHHVSLAEDEARALALALRGAAIAEVCTAFELDEDPARRAASVLQAWFAREWVGDLARVEET